MATSVPPPDGINEKLERADHHIQNLQAEISAFFKGCRYPTIPKLNDQTILEAIEYHKNLTIPLRFSVLVGEISHHLRASLDYIVWALSANDYRTGRNGRYIEFPCMEKRPIKEHVFTRYTRKIQGISSLRVRKIIVALQPYRRPDARDSSLFIIHSMDIIDKHQSLVMMSGFGQSKAPRHISAKIEALRGGRFPDELRREFDQYCEITPQIAIRNVRGGPIQSVIPTLEQSLNFVRGIVTLLGDDLRKC